MAYTDTFVFYYQWRQGSGKVEQWNTEIITANDGTEQRRARITTPREKFNVNVFLSTKEVNVLNNIIYTQRDLEWMLPFWNEAQVVSSISSGAGSITIDTDDVRFIGGHYLFIFESYEKYEAIEISTSPPPIGGTVTLEENVIGNYTNAFVMPAKLAYMKDNPTRSTTGRQGEASFSFELAPGNGFPDFPWFPPSLPTHLIDFEIFSVLSIQPDRISQLMPEQAIKRIDLVDYGYGDIQRYSPWPNIKLRREFKYICYSHEDVMLFRQFFMLILGRVKAFAIPTFEGDFRLTNTGSVTTTLTFHDDKQHLVALTRGANVFIQYLDGTATTNKLSSYVDNGNGTYSATCFNLGGIDASQIHSICYLQLVRLDTDNIQYTFLGNGITEIKISVIHIKDPSGGT